MQETREGMRCGRMPAYCNCCPSNLYLQKEDDLDRYVPHLLRAKQWRQASVVKKTHDLAGRALTGIRTAGLHSTAKRTKEWLQLKAWQKY